MPKKKIALTVEETGPDGESIKYELTKEEYALVLAYFSNGMNQTRAYMEVYKFSESRYNSARTTSSQVFAKPNIQAGIRKIMRDNAMGADEVLSRLASMARASHLPFIKVDDDGAVYFDFSQPEALEHLYLIKKIKTKRDRRVDGRGKSAEEWESEWVEVELHDAQAALRDIGRYHKLFTDKTLVEGEIQLVKKTVGVDLDKV